MKKNSVISIALFCVIFCFGTLKGQKEIYLDVNQPIDKRIESALSKMTLEEKVAMCHAQSKFSSKGVPRLGIPEVNLDWA